MKKSRSLFTEYLEPALTIAQIAYDKFETQSETWVSEWVKQLDSDTYTDFVLIGGDGLFN